MRPLPILSALCLLISVAFPAGAQSFTFSSCASGVTFRATITSIISSTGPVALPPDGTRSYTYIFNGTYSLTVGSSTQTSTGLGAIGILYTGLGVTAPFTTFRIEGPNAAGDGPGTGAARSARAWGANLQGVGDLLPNGLSQNLPSLSNWTLFNSDYLFGDGRTLGLIDIFGACPPSVGRGGKTLGDAWGLTGSCFCGDPINVGTGNLFEQFADYRTAGQNRLSFTRYYNSLGAAANTLAATLGVNWRSTYDRHLRIVSASSVIAERENGQQLNFTLSGAAWTPDTDVDFRLTNSGTTWTLTDTSDSVETYTTANATQALLRTIRARNGYTQNLQYNAANQLTSVTDSYNRRLSFTYGNSLLQTVTTPDTLTLTYGYATGSAGSRLTSVAYSTSPVTRQTYLYENTALPNALTGIVDENGSRFATWTYDSTGRALSSQQGAGAGVTRIAYNDTDGSRTVTTPLGVSTVYRFTTLQNMPKVTQIDRLATATTPAGTIRFTYDGNGYTASRTDWNGVLTTYVNDARGRPVSMVEAAQTPQARTTTYFYHATFHLPIRVAEPGISSTFAYDAGGNLLTKTYSDTTATTVPYSTNGETRTWTYTWSDSLLTSIKKPRADPASVTRFTYDASGALSSVANALGQTTRITQSLPGGLPLTIVDPNGVTTRFTYDARMRLLTRTVSTAAGPLTTKYSYDAAGNTIGVTQPDGSAFTYGFDTAHRLIHVADLFDQSIDYTLDALGGRTLTSVLDAGRTQKLKRAKTFDALGRLRQDIGAAGQTTSYAYDGNGNMLTATDPLGRVVQQSYDARNRLVRVTDPARGVTTTGYDALDRPTSVTDPNGGVTTYVYNGFGEVIQRVSPDSGTTVYRYDLNGKLTQRVDAAGSVASYTYDALDRVIAATYPGNAAENVTYTYDQAGRLTTVKDAAGTLSRSYDERGNVLSEVRVNGAVTLRTAYTYDAADRVASISYPSGWTAAYTRDAMGRTTAVTAQAPDGSEPKPILSGVGYQSFGPLSGFTFGNGVAETRGFDLDYRITSLADTGATAIQSLTYTYDASNNISSIADGVTPGSSQTFGYDALDRLTSATGAYGSRAYTHDAVGNRLTQTVDGSEATYSYTPRSNQLASVTHTKAGHIDNFNPAVGVGASLTYSQAGRLASVTAGRNEARYTYDAFGQRLVKVSAATTLYQYDRMGRLLEETDGEGNAQVDYIYLGDLPVATLSPSTGDIYFLHADRLGTPQVATDSGQNVMWTASYGPFGEMSAIPSLIVQNLRLPGQEFDADTGLYHNGFRDYVPGWGRYLQTDPVGLAGGLNTYSYVGGNPISRVDRTGEMWWLIPLAAFAHYERNALNEPATLAQATSCCESPQDPACWRELPYDQSRYHNPEGGNRKFVHPDGSEAVFTKNGEVETNPLYEATYNIFNPDTAWGVPHVIFDVVPYLVLGNTYGDLFTTHRFEVTGAVIGGAIENKAINFGFYLYQAQNALQEAIANW